MDLFEMQETLPPEFRVEDACALLSEDYKAPLKRLGAMQRAGVLIRLKRGLYAFSNGFDKVGAAGAIYGPSYVSFETALAYYGLIPERVDTVMSVVDGRPASFTTPVGLYEYHAQGRTLFAEGMGMVQLERRSYLIATREKALLDTLNRAHLSAAELSFAQVLDFVVEGMRVDFEDLQGLSLRKLRRLAKLYRNLAPGKLVMALQQRVE